MKRILIFLAVAMVVVCGIGGYVFIKMRAAGAELAKDQAGKTATVTRGELVATVVDNGTIEAVKTVELKSNVGGRLARLLVDEGDPVRAGQLIAVVDPKETQLRVAQDRAQLAGAVSATERADIQIQQRRISAQAELRQAQARLAQLRAQLKVQPELTSASIRGAEAEYRRTLRERESLQRTVHPNARTSAESALLEAKANYATTKSEYDRQTQLLEKGWVSKREVEASKLNLDLAKVRLDSATDNVSRLDSQFKLDMAKADEAIRQSEAAMNRARANAIEDGVKRQEYLSAVADVDRAKAALQDVQALAKGRDQNQASVQQITASLQDSERLLGETEIRAPVNGVVTKKYLQQGELVAALSGFSSGTPIVRIEDRTVMRVKLNVNEIDVAKMTEGMQATINVDALPDKELHGYVKKIAPASLSSATQQAATSDAVVKYEVEIWVQDREPRLRSGMSAKCSLDVLRKNNVLLLPTEYLGHEGKKWFVELPSKNPDPKAKPERRDITIGAQTGSMAEIVSGVTEGMKVARPSYKGPPRKGMMQAGPDEGG